MLGAKTRPCPELQFSTRVTHAEILLEQPVVRSHCVDPALGQQLTSLVVAETRIVSDLAYLLFKLDAITLHGLIDPQRRHGRTAS